MNHSISERLAQARRLAQSGQLKKSAQLYRQLVALDSKNPVVQFEFGVAEYQLGQHQSALTHLRKAIELDPDQANFHNGLGIVLSDTGDLPAGANCFRRALELNPNNPVTHNNLGSNYKKQGQLNAAIECYRKALSANPQYVDAALNLGEALRLQGQPLPALDVYRRALAVQAGSPDLQFNLAVTLHYLERHEESISTFNALITKHPRYAGARNNLGLGLMKLGRFEEAIENYNIAIENEPDAAAPHNNLGNAFRDLNRIDEAISSYRQALALRPDHAQAHSNLLLILNYLPDISQSAHYEAAVQFETRQATNSMANNASSRPDNEKHRRLRIGYVSPDFRAHSVAHFTIELMGTHDRNQVEIFCYANVTKPDEITNKFLAQADHWISIVGMSDQDAAAKISEDQIDILVDLAGHTAGNRLQMFALKPAPIQVNWLGYPNTTGLTAMDYRLTDSIADPMGPDDHWHSEQLIRLPSGFLCYQTREANPPVSASPCLSQGYVTFGSFNSLPKVTSEVVRVWCEILKTSPDSHLILKSRAFAHETTRTHFLQDFSGRGIAPERIELLSLIPGRNQHLAAYSRIDISLDPFPYNGTTTTCESLWMGVPVISLRGDRHAGRVGASILHHASVPELLAESEDDYIACARSLAADQKRLVELRETLRETLRASSLMDTEQFTRSLENAYRDMWKTWCADSNKNSPVS